LLKKRIKSELGISPSISNVLSITTARQYDALMKCQESISAVSRLLKNNPVSFELVSIELREALDNIGAILGKTTPDDILNNIFGQFCVGK
jgi:tRNA modification GTPase